MDFFRTMAAGDIIARSFGLLKTYLEALVLIVLVPQGLLLGGTMALERAVPPDATLLWMLVATTVVNAVAFAAVTAALTGVALGATPTMMGAYAIAFRSHPLGIIAAYAATGMVTAAGFMLFVVPGLVAGGFLALVIPVMVVEGLPPMAAVARSIAMIRTDPLKGIAIFSFVIGVGGLLPLLFLIVVGNGPFIPLLSALLGSVALPLAYTANVLLYFSYRAREGFSRDALEREISGALGR